MDTSNNQEKTLLGSPWLMCCFSLSLAAMFPMKMVAHQQVRQDTLMSYAQWEKQHEVQKEHYPLGVPDTLQLMDVFRSPTLSLQQKLKGKIAGLYVQEPNGEPGTLQGMLIRGTSVPLFSKVSEMYTQPAVYINGVPVIDDRDYSYFIRNNDVNPLGTASNLFAALDLNNIESIEVVKDPYELAKLGPLAANGAIWITTRDGYYGGSNVTVDANVTAAFSPLHSIHMTNAMDERNFRSTFYPQGVTLDDYLPAYLKDQSDAYFFGLPDWAKDYYSTPALEYNLNATIGGGKGMANYLFTLGTTRNAGTSDHTGYNKYNLNFYLNLMPVKGLTVSTVIQAAKSGRTRNTALRDRLAETQYIPELTTPLSPTKEGYGLYRSYFDDDNVRDENNNMMLNGSLSLEYAQRAFKAGVSLKFDYSTNVRHAFWPTALTEGFNYVSDYSGYNRRAMGDFHVGYDFRFAKKHILSVEAKGALWEDRYHYNYSKGYDGGNDKNQSSYGSSYKMLRFLDQENLHYMSSSLNLNYKWSDYLSIGAIVRYDASSSVQQNHRWLFTPAANINWNIKSSLLNEVSWLSAFSLYGSWAKVGRYMTNDRFGVGAQYTSDNLGWTGDWLVGSYNGFAGVSRPYSTGWIGFGMEWPYSEKAEVGLHSAWLDNRLFFNVAFYSNKDKNLVIKLPTNHEFGYSSQYKQGMEITNKGLEVTLSGTIIRQPKDGWQWSADVNFAYNHNELTALPGGLTEVVTDGRMLKVGEAVDRFYVLQNRGIYTSDNQVPEKDGKKLSINNVPFHKGDPVWADVNGDNVINEKDKVQVGHSLPKYTGGFSTTLKYRRFDLNASFFFALGQKVMNYRAYQTYDFTTLDNARSLDAVKEIFFWQSGVPMDYPRYNVLSNVHPYRADQDLYLENASYLKLRSVTLGYRVPVKKGDVYLYVSGNNLLTVSGFSGDDPELVDFDGYYRGYGLSIPRSVTVGIRCKF